MGGLVVGDIPQWRVGNAALHDVMCDAGRALVARLATRGAVDEIAEVRAGLLTIDPSNRIDVLEHLAQLRKQIAGER